MSITGSLEHTKSDGHLESQRSLSKFEYARNVIMCFELPDETKIIGMERRRRTDHVTIFFSMLAKLNLVQLCISLSLISRSLSSLTSTRHRKPIMMLA